MGRVCLLIKKYYDVEAYLHSEVREMGILYGIVLSILWRKEVLPR